MSYQGEQEPVILQLDLLYDSLNHFVIMANKGQFIMQDHPNDAQQAHTTLQVDDGHLC